MFRLLGFSIPLLVGTVLGPTLIQQQPVNRQVLSDQTMFSVPARQVSESKEVAPDKATNTDSSDDQSGNSAAPTNSRTYRSSNSQGGYASSGGAYARANGSAGGYSSNNSQGGSYTTARRFGRVRQYGLTNAYSGCPCNCANCPGGPNCPCGGNCGCPSCNCGQQAYVDDGPTTDTVYTGPAVVYRRPGLFGRLAIRRAARMQSQTTGVSTFGAWRSNACPSCGNCN